MELLPGEHIAEPQLSSMLGISRTPIREALRLLEAEGMVVLSRNRGAAVRSFTEEEISQIGAVRLSGDILAARLAAYYGSASDFDRLARIADECAGAAAAGDAYGRISLDCDFHLGIARVSGNEPLYRQLHALYQQVRLIHISQYSGIEDSLVQIHHHGPILDAVRSGDLRAVSALICDHIRDFYHIHPYLLECYKND